MANFERYFDLGDENLKKNICYSLSTKCYLSPTIQNEIIEICGNLITKKLVTDINKAGCFTIVCKPIIISLQDIQDTTRSVSSSASLFLAAVEKCIIIIYYFFVGLRTSFKFYASVITLPIKSDT